MIEIKTRTKYKLAKYSLEDNDQFILEKGTIILGSEPLTSGYEGTDGEKGTWESGQALRVLVPISPSKIKGEEK